MLHYLTSELIWLLWVCYIWFSLPKENLVTMRKYHLFDITNTRRKIQIFQNEKFYFSLHRAGPLPWKKRTNRSKLPVSTPTAFSSADIWLLAEQNLFNSTFIAIMIWILFAMKLASKKRWNVLCHVILPILLVCLTVWELKIPVWQVRIFILKW